MAIKPNGDLILLAEQIIEDEVTGLTLQITAYPDGASKLTIYGDFEFGNRDFFFNQDGVKDGSGTAMVYTAPSWLREVQTTDEENPEPA